MTRVLPAVEPAVLVGEGELRDRPPTELNDHVDPPLGDFVPPGRYVPPMWGGPQKALRAAKTRTLPGRNMDHQKKKFRFRGSGLAVKLLPHLSAHTCNPKSKLRQLIWSLKRRVGPGLRHSHRLTFFKQLKHWRGTGFPQWLSSDRLTGAREECFWRTCVAWKGKLPGNAAADADGLAFRTCSEATS